MYTLTKAFAERAAETLWAEHGHRLSVVRPAIIESAVQHPFPGWIDGFKVADPLILAYGRGLLPEFPGLPDSVLDLIPVDHVVNAILAVAANPAPAGEPQYYQVASGASNPLPFHEMFENVNEYFTQNPMPQPGKGHIRVPTWEFPGGRVVERKLANKAKLADRYEKFLHRMPSSKRNRRALAKLQTQRADLETLRNFTELYRAYVQTEIIFDDTNTRALHASLPGRAAGRPRLRHHRRRLARLPAEGALPGDHRDDAGVLEASRVGRRAQAPARPAAADGCRGRLRHGGHGRRLQHRAAVPLGALGGVPQGGLAGRGAQHPRHRCRATCVPSAGTAASSSGSSSVATRGCRSPASRRSSTAATATRCGGTRASRRSKRIREHRAAGHRTVLVSGSIASLAKPIADLFDEVVAGEMHEKDGVLTGYLARPPLVDEARAAWLTQYAAKHGLDLAGSYGYGDSHADLVWLDLLGHPHAVNPDTQLAREAQRRRWAIDDWKRGTGVSKRALMNSNSTASTAASD